MKVKTTTSYWYTLVKQARERGIQTTGEFIVGLALMGIRPTPEGIQEIAREYARPYIQHSAN